MRALVALFFIVTLDVTKVLDRGSSSRYLILLIPFGAFVIVRAGNRSSIFRRPLLADKVLAVMTVVGLLGSVYGRLHLHTGSTALPIFVPMPMAFLYLGMLEEPKRDEVRKILFAICLVGLLYVCLNGLANSGLAARLQASRSYRNAEVMYIAMGGAALLASRRWGLLFVFIAIAAFVFKTYPSATFAIVVLVTLITLFMTRPVAAYTRVWIVGISVVLVLVVLLLNFSSAVQLANDYFLSVGKRNNTNTRLALWSAGLHKFQGSPIYGDLFTGETTVTVARRAGGGALFKNPYNNDYILFAASGGAIFFVLLMTWIVLTEITMLRRYHRFIATGQYSHAALLRTLLVGFNAWLTAAAFNPLFQGMGRSVTLFSIYGLMMLVGRPDPGAPDEIAEVGLAT
jgi:hypothetical protein